MRIAPLFVLASLLALTISRVALAAWAEIDTFDSRDPGLLDGQGDWVATEIYEVVTDPTDAQNQVLQVLPVGGAENAFSELSEALEDGTTGSLYFRFWPSDDLSHMNFGLSDVNPPGDGGWNDFEAQIRDNQQGGLDFRDNGGFTNLLDFLEIEEWYQVWMVIDNNEDVLQGYIQSEVSFPEQTPLTAGAQDTFDFRFGTDDPLSTFYLRAGANHEGDWYLDDVYLDLDGENLSVPGLGGAPQLQPGDADQDFDFDQLDLVKVQIAAKYLSGAAATWGEGDWDAAPGGEQGSPPAGNGFFDQLDIVSALGAGKYLTGPYAALATGGEQGDDNTSLVYDTGTGELSVDPPAGKELTSINITSAGSQFIGDKPAVLDGAFDNFAGDNIFKATFGGSFGNITFGNVLPAGMSEADVTADLTAVGSLAGGGDLGDVDLVFIPEPSALLLIVLGLLGVTSRIRRR